MKTINVYGVTIIAALAIIASSAMISSGIANADKDQAPEVQVGRWIVQNQFEGGWNVFDTATGNFCSIPNGNVPTQQVTCTEKH